MLPLNFWKKNITKKWYELFYKNCNIDCIKIKYISFISSIIKILEKRYIFKDKKIY